MPDEPPITQQAQGSYIAQATHGGTATVQIVLPPAPVQEQNRVRMLSRLRYLYDEEWEQSLEGASLLTLGFVSKPDVILHHPGLLFLSPHQPERPLPPGTSIAQVYEQAGQELLILGEPGAGKSTLLLDLARRLVEHAEQDAAHPFPVIIPLSSWAIKRQPLADWLSEQLTQLYDVPRRLSHSWVQTDQLVLLLDGLDEVPQEARVACIQAIAAYRKEHLVPLVVCSRRTEFEEIPRHQRLIMHSAVVVLPLTQEQVRAYLLGGNEAFSALRTVLHSNPVLAELVTTPLILHILTLTYTGSKARDLPQGGSPEEQQRRIFANYIERMIERRRNRISFPLQRIIPWLSWLARQMKQHSQTVFYIEHMQPSWFSGDRTHQVYDRWAVQFPAILMGMLVTLTISLVIFGPYPLSYTIIAENTLLGGFIGWLLGAGRRSAQRYERNARTRGGTWPRLVGRLRVGGLIGLGCGLCASVNIVQVHGIAALNYWLVGGVINGLGLGLGSMLLQVLLEQSHTTAPSLQSQPQSRELGLWHFLQHTGIGNGILVGLVSGLSAGMGVGVAIGLTHGLAGSSTWLIDGLKGLLNFGLLLVGLVSGLSGGLLSLLLSGKSRAISLTDELVWSWRSLGRSLLARRNLSRTLQVMVFVGLASGLTYMISQYGQVSDWLNLVIGLGLFSWMLLGLLEGVSSEIIGDQHRIVPNQGIRLSTRNGLVLGLISAGIAWLITGLFVWESGWAWLLVTGLIVGLLVGLLNGGLACLRHYVLRFLLWRSGAMPWHYVRFLDEEAGCILLRRVGGGYSFVHRLILDYFASLENPLTKPELL